jgi:hypothetical protein
VKKRCVKSLSMVSRQLGGSVEIGGPSGAAS